MSRPLLLICLTSLATALAQARALDHQRDTSGDSDLSLYITTDKILANSPLLGNSGISSRVPVDVVVTNATTIAATGTLVIAADSTALLYDWVA